MFLTDRYAHLVQLLQEAGHAHHQAYLASDGADPEWPLWYAAYLQTALSDLLGQTLTQSQIVYLIVGLDQQHQEEAPTTPWYEFYARRLLAEEHDPLD